MNSKPTYPPATKCAHGLTSWFATVESSCPVLGVSESPRGSEEDFSLVVGEVCWLCASAMLLEGVGKVMNSLFVNIGEKSHEMYVISSYQVHIKQL